jgi:hydrogenase-1 operon protein HyaE
MSSDGVATAAVHPLVAALTARHGYASLEADAFDAFAAARGATLIVLLEDPARYRETLDLAVVVPEIVRAFPGAFRVGVPTAACARAIAARHAIRRWPALLLLRDGGYVGAVEGLRDWDDYLAAMASLLAAPVRRLPGIGIAVRGTDATSTDGSQEAL